MDSSISSSSSSSSSKPFSLALVLLFFFFSSFEGARSGVLFSQLPRTLDVTASPLPGQVLKAGDDTITVTWALNHTAAATIYKSVEVKLCFAPVSQVDRKWRQTSDDLHKDKTCQFTINDQPFSSSSSSSSGGGFGGGSVSFTYAVAVDIPTATYFIRAYALNAAGEQVAYGQTTDAQKTKNLFKIVGVSGRRAALDIAAGCFSAFSLLTLVFFLVKEKIKAN